MADIQTQLPVRISDGNDVTINDLGGGNYALVVDTASGATLAIDDGGGSLTVDNGGTPLGIDDAGGSLTIDDGGGSITVDGAVTVTSNTEYAEDSAHTSTDVGQFVLAVRNDTETSLVSATGDYAPLQVDSVGRLKVDAEFNSAFDYAEDSPHASGDQGAFFLAVRNDSGTSLVSTDGDYAPLQVDASGNLRVNGSFSSSVEYAEDTPHTTGDNGNFALVVRQDTLGSLAGTSGDYTGLSVNSDGALYVTDVASTGTVTEYGTSAAVADGATGTISHTAVGTFYCKGVIASASGGPCRVEVQNNSATVAVGFFSTSVPFIQFDFKQPIVVTSGNDLDVIIQNDAGSAQDVYATIMGVEA